MVGDKGIRVAARAAANDAICRWIVLSGLNKNQVYDQLKTRFGKQVNVGELSLEQCQDVCEFCFHKIGRDMADKMESHWGLPRMEG